MSNTSPNPDAITMMLAEAAYFLASSRPMAKLKTADREPDPRFAPVAKAFARTAGFSLMESKSGAMRGLMLNGKSFGMSQDGRFILKFDEPHVAKLIGDGIGKPFSPAAGRVMKGWIEVTSAKANWVALAKQAHKLAAAGPAKKPKRAK